MFPSLAVSFGSACEDLQEAFLALRNNYKRFETDMEYSWGIKPKWDQLGVDIDNDEQIRTLACKLTGIDIFLIYFWFKYDLGQKYQAPQVRPDRGSNS